jgi:hypothetical protein
LKAYQWADYIRTYPNAKDLYGIASCDKISRTSILEIDENPQIVVQDPLKALAVAVFASPLLSTTEHIFDCSLKCLIDRLGKETAIDLVSEILNTNEFYKREIEIFHQSSSSGSSDFNKSQELAIVHLINHIVIARADSKMSGIEIISELVSLAVDDRVFVLQCRSVMLPFSWYFSELCRANYFDSKLYKDYEIHLKSLLDCDLWKVIMSRISSDMNSVFLLEHLGMMEGMARRNRAFLMHCISILENLISNYHGGII